MLCIFRNGVDRSGLFCVLYAVIARLRVEQDVAITQVVEQMRCCRDQIIPSVVSGFVYIGPSQANAQGLIRASFFY